MGRKSRRRQGTAGRPSEPRPRQAQQAAGRQEPAAAAPAGRAVVDAIASTRSIEVEPQRLRYVRQAER